MAALIADYGVGAVRAATDAIFELEDKFLDGEISIEKFTADGYKAIDNLRGKLADANGRPHSDGRVYPPSV